MPVSALIRKQYSVANSVFSPLRDWMRKCKLIRQCRQQLDECDSYEVARIARDVGVSPHDLRRMVKLGPDATKLLLSRMDALHLNGDALARSEPDVMRDLQRLCSTCANKKRCKRNLAHDSKNPVWRQYCPNESTLVALQSSFAADH
jgi:transposase-like protein